MDLANGVEDGRREADACCDLHDFAPAGGDTANAECVVYFFGNGQGGSVEANLDRWKGQVHDPDGKPVDAKVAKRRIHGLAVTTIDSSGDYGGMGGPMAASKTVQSNYRLLGAIVEEPNGNVFIKFYGAGEDHCCQPGRVRAVAELIR